jgi:hypothetical protein
MKTFGVLFLFLSFIACQPKDLPTVFDVSQGYALMKVSHQTTRAELKQMADKLALQEFQVDYTGSEFYENDKLQKLKLYIVTPDGNKGVTTADIVALQFRYFGFLYQKEGNPSFKIGEI